MKQPDVSSNKKEEENEVLRSIDEASRLYENYLELKDLAALSQTEKENDYNNLFSWKRSLSFVFSKGKNNYAFME